MEKLVYLLFQNADFPGPHLREGLLHEAVPALRAAGAHWISVNVHDEDVVRTTTTEVERWEELPSQRWISDPPARAMVSFWMQCAEERAACERALEPHAIRLNGYLVSESIPLVNTAQRASIGERTPGFNQVSSLVKRRDVSDDEFRDIWLHDQKLIAIECQSSFGYKRNSIVRPMTAGARNYLGIVEENFPIEALTDPRVFYDASSETQLRERVDRMTRNVERFLQMDEVELTPMSEYLLG
jgi:hypothetical protein